MTEFELYRLQQNEWGALIHVTVEQTKMVIGIYLILKVLILKILLKPKESGMVPHAFNYLYLSINFKILGSVLYYVFMEFIEQMIPGYGNTDDMFL